MHTLFSGVASPARLQVARGGKGGLYQKAVCLGWHACPTSSPLPQPWQQAQQQMQLPSASQRQRLHLRPSSAVAAAPGVAFADGAGGVEGWLEGAGGAAGRTGWRRFPSAARRRPYPAGRDLGGWLAGWLLPRPTAQTVLPCAPRSRRGPAPPTHQASQTAQPVSRNSAPMVAVAVSCARGGGAGEGEEQLGRGGAAQRQSGARRGAHAAAPRLGMAHRGPPCGGMADGQRGVGGAAVGAQPTMPAPAGVSMPLSNTRSATEPSAQSMQWMPSPAMDSCARWGWGTGGRSAVQETDA